MTADELAELKARVEAPCGACLGAVGPDRPTDAPTEGIAGVIAGLETLAEQDGYNGLQGETCRKAARFLRAQAECIAAWQRWERAAAQAGTPDEYGWYNKGFAQGRAVQRTVAGTAPAGKSSDDAPPQFSNAEAHAWAQGWNACVGALAGGAPAAPAPEPDEEKLREAITPIANDLAAYWYEQGYKAAVVSGGPAGSPAEPPAENQETRVK